MPPKERYTPPPPPVVGATASGGDRFLGVPDDYVTDYRGSDIIPGQVQMRPDLHPLQVTPTYETKGPNTTSAIAAIASLPPESMARLQIRLAKAGLIGSSTRVAVGVADDATVSAYRELLGIANRYGMNDTDALALLESDPDARPAGGATGADLINGGGGESREPTTHTSTTTQKFTPLDAKSLANQAYQDALGQDATPKQRRALRAALNEYAKAHPSTSTTTTDADGNSTTTSGGGIDAAGVQQIAVDQARSAPNYAEVQASTTHMNWLQEALGATADVG